MKRRAAEVQTRLLPIDELHGFPGNSNEMDTLQFERLVKEIEQDGFEEPLVVVPRQVIEPGLDGFTVVSGNHRLAACRRNGFEEVECVVHNDWDRETAVIKVVKRNMMRGEQDADKFTKLVDSLQGYTHDQLADAMGFRDVDHFAEYYKNQHHFGNASPDAAGVTQLIEGLSVILNNLFTEYGDTVPYGFMYFLWGKKVHLTVQTTPRLKRLLNNLTKRCWEDNLDVNAVLTKLLETGMEALDFENKVQDPTQFEQHADPDEEDEAFEPIVGAGEDE